MVGEADMVAVVVAVVTVAANSLATLTNRPAVGRKEQPPFSVGIFAHFARRENRLDTLPQTRYTLTFHR